jgi:hypothetical protein
MFPRVVTKEDNSSTATHVSRKRQPKWVPGAWGVAGPPCLGCKKCSRRGLQVGVWVTDRQPVTVEKANC